MKLTFSRGHYNKHAAWKRLFVFEYPVTCKQKISKSTLILLKLM